MADAKVPVGTIIIKMVGRKVDVTFENPGQVHAGRLSRQFGTIVRAAKNASRKARATQRQALMEKQAAKRLADSRKASSKATSKVTPKKDNK